MSDKFSNGPYGMIVVPGGGSFEDMVRLKGDAEGDDLLGDAYEYAIPASNIIPNIKNGIRGTAHLCNGVLFKHEKERVIYHD